MNNPEKTIIVYQGCEFELVVSEAGDGVELSVVPLSENATEEQCGEVLTTIADELSRRLEEECSDDH